VKEDGRKDGRTCKVLPPDVMGLQGRFNMSGLTDSIRERRAREIRFGDGWEEEDGEEAKFEPRAWTLGLFCAQRFQTPDEAAEAIMRIRQGRLSLEYLMWNGKTTPLLPTDRC
jgi:hypothetical protein